MKEAAPGGYKLQAWLYIVFWISISCTMILFNKAVLDQMEFPFPMFLTTWHMFFSTVLTQIMARTSNWLPGVKEKKVDGAAMRTQILPVALCYAVSLVLANKAYIYLSVSYIQMLKAFTPVAVLVFSFFSGLEKTSCMELYIVTVICVGVAMASVGETFFSWVGFTCQSLAILAESSRLVLTNLLMRQLKLGKIETNCRSSFFLCTLTSATLTSLFSLLSLSLRSSVVTLLHCPRLHVADRRGVLHLGGPGPSV
jgi:Triose-phosphate Transporter family